MTMFNPIDALDDLEEYVRHLETEYNQNGQATLKRAEQEKQVMIEQARSELESAKLRADAIQIVGKAAKEYPEYRTQEFIGAFAEAMQNGAIDKIIYVPTEANIPITEAGRV